MTSASIPPASRCQECGGRGRKLVTLRRAAHLSADEKPVVRRRTVACLACGGTGRAPGKGQAS